MLQFSNKSLGGCMDVVTSDVCKC